MPSIASSGVIEEVMVEGRKREGGVGLGFVKEIDRVERRQTVRDTFTGKVWKSRSKGNRIDRIQQGKLGKKKTYRKAQTGITEREKRIRKDE